MPQDFEVHGHTVGCPGCAHLQHGLGARRGPNDACRSRMEEAIGAADSDRAKRHTDKMDQYAAAEGERIILEDGKPAKTEERIDDPRPDDENMGIATQDLTVGGSGV